MPKTTIAAIGMAFLLAACGADEEDRALSGGAIGAGTGAVVGGPVGAVAGAGIGAATGAVTEEDDLDMGEPAWDQ
ncbi:MAG TPA: hypothetical protein VFO41_17065 [Alphaproteobacteria bacterium]|nr:hypothetical protein [Alphaproteobacteria bacterium]